MRQSLREAREGKGFTVTQMAQASGISASFYYKIEQGIRNPTMSLAKKLADLLGRSVDDLFFAQELDETSRGFGEQAATLDPTGTGAS
jgi:putative transcriptional regulator